jgi:DNA-binding GntR family transcriptional regulator
MTDRAADFPLRITYPLGTVNMLPWLINNPASLMTGVRETSLGKLVRDEMLTQILRGDLEPGQRINEPDVAARLRVSRVPVREALRELESSGLVEARKHSGVFVRVLDRKDVADLYALRSVLDGHAGRRVAQLDNASRRGLIKQLTRLVREMKGHARRHAIQAYYMTNLSFHWTIVEAANNQQLALVYRGIVQQLHLSRLKNLSQDFGMQVSSLEHEQIVSALSEGDADRCQRLQELHVTASHVRLLDLDRPNRSPR